VNVLKKNSVIRYFDTKASEYDSMKVRGFTGKLAEKESRAILEFLNVKNGDEVLDAGCGSGFYSDFIRRGGGIPFGVDLSEKMIDEFKDKSFEGVVGDIETINLGKKFDKILCAGALEFVGDPIKTVENLSRHLRDDGLLVLLYPSSSFIGLLYRLFHLTHGIKAKLYNDSEITEIMVISGLEVVHMKQITFISKVIKAKQVKVKP